MQSLHPSRVRRALDGAKLNDVLRDRETAAKVARRLGMTPGRLIHAIRRMTAGELAALEGPEVEGPEVEGPEVEGPAVEGPEVEGPNVEGPNVEGRSPDLAELGRRQLAARVERVKLWRELELLRGVCAGQREQLEELGRIVHELEEEVEALRERLDLHLAPAGPQG